MGVQAAQQPDQRMIEIDFRLCGMAFGALSRLRPKGARVGRRSWGLHRYLCTRDLRPVTPEVVGISRRFVKTSGAWNAGE